MSYRDRCGCELMNKEVILCHQHQKGQVKIEVDHGILRVETVTPPKQPPSDECGCGGSIHKDDFSEESVNKWNKYPPTNTSSIDEEWNKELRKLISDALFTVEYDFREAHNEILEEIHAHYLKKFNSIVPEYRDGAYYTKHPVTWKPIAPESNAEHYDAGFNQAINTIKENINRLTKER